MQFRITRGRGEDDIKTNFNDICYSTVDRMFWGRKLWTQQWSFRWLRRRRSLLNSWGTIGLSISWMDITETTRRESLEDSVTRGVCHEPLEWQEHVQVHVDVPRHLKRIFSLRAVLHKSLASELMGRITQAACSELINTLLRQYRLYSVQWNGVMIKNGDKKWRHPIFRLKGLRKIMNSWG
jgi:hypothetical protein